MKGLYLRKETIFVGEPTIKNQLKISRAGYDGKTPLDFTKSPLLSTF